MSLPKILIVNKSFPKAGLQILKQKAHVTVIPHYDYDPESLTEIRKNMNDCDAIIWNTKHRLTKEMLDLAGPRLKAVSTMASGFDQIDVKALAQRGLPLGNTPNALNDAVADIAVGLMIAAARRFKEGIRVLESGEWKFGVQMMLGQDIKDSTVGIIGLGGIGLAIVNRLKGFKVKRFIYSGRSDKPEAKTLQVERVPLEDLLKESDFVIICCPLSNETKNLINKDTLNLMKETSVLVNIARGGVIDQHALYEALEAGKIFAAGLDVTTPEPLSKDEPIVSLPNCFSDISAVFKSPLPRIFLYFPVILPHLGSATTETRNAMSRISAQNILLALEGKPMLYTVS